jgi:hypothetical protein
MFDSALFDSVIFDTEAVAVAQRGGAGGDAKNPRKPRAVIVHFEDEEMPTETPPTEVVAPTTPYPKRKVKPKTAKPAPIEDHDEEEAILMLLAA